MGEFDLTLGMLYIGVLVNTYLYGTTTFRYGTIWRQASQARRVTNLLGALSFFLDTLFCTTIIYTIWYYAIVNYTVAAGLKLGFWAYYFSPLVSATTAFIVQMFMARRIHTILNNSYIYGALLEAISALYVLSLYTAAHVWATDSMDEVGTVYKLKLAMFAIQAGVNLTLSGLFVFIVVKTLEQGVKLYEQPFTALFSAVIRSGIFTAVLSVAGLACYAKYPDTNVYAVFIIPIGRFYTLTLLDTLVQPEAPQMKAASTGKSGTETSATTNLSGLRWHLGTSHMLDVNASRVLVSFSQVEGQTMNTQTDATSTTAEVTDEKKTFDMA